MKKYYLIDLNTMQPLVLVFASNKNEAIETLQPLTDEQIVVTEERLDHFTMIGILSKINYLDILDMFLEPDENIIKDRLTDYMTAIEGELQSDFIDNFYSYFLTKLRQE